MPPLIRRIDKINPNIRLGLPELSIPHHIYMFSRTPRQLPQMARNTLAFRSFNLVFNLAGGGTAIINNVPLKFRPGNAILVFPEQPRHYMLDRPHKFLWLFVGFQLDACTALQPLASTVMQAPRACRTGLVRLLKDYITARSREAPHPEHTVRLSLTLWQLLAQLADCQATGAGRRLPAPALADDIAARVQTLALEEPAEYCNSRRIARALNVSPQTLNRHFRQVAGESLSLFLRKQRICRARDLLNSSRLSIKEIAAACGFSSPNTLSRAFKQMLKIPPRRYRAQRK